MSLPSLIGDMAAFLENAQAQAADIDTDLLWEVCGEEEFTAEAIAVKLGKDIVCLHFGAFAVLGIDLVGGVVFLDDGGNFELAGLFVKDIHFFRIL